MKIGAQMFTTRATCQTLEGFADTLKRIADIGYTTVQVSGTCPYEGEWLRDQLKLNGLKCVLTHIPVPRLTGELDKVIEDHNTFDCKYVGLGFWAFDEARNMTWDQWMETFPPIAHKLKEGGKYFMYHNHAREFQKIGQKTILRQMAEDFSPEVMGFTFDTYWAQVGGADPAAYLELLSGRIPVIHLKDCGYGQKMEVIGEGNINFDRVFEKAEAGGTKYMLVEQDNCNGEDPFSCLKKSYDYLTSLGLS